MLVGDECPSPTPISSPSPSRALKVTNENILTGIRMETQNYLVETISIIIDRPLGSQHPEWGYINPLNYGFVPGVKSIDGGELDAYILGIFEPLGEFKGQCIAIVRRKNDDDKLVLTPPGRDYTDEQIIALVEFQEWFFISEVVRAESSEPI